MVRLEERFFTEQGEYEQLLAVEDELFHDYTQPCHVAEAERLAPPPRQGSAVTSSSPAAAALVLPVASSWLVLEAALRSCVMAQYRRPLIAFVCALSLLSPTTEQLLLAVASPAYRGPTIRGRASVAIVSAPGRTSVNTFSGTLIVRRTPLVIPGRGLPIELSLTYNSDDDDVDGPFGFGWRFSYGIAYILQSDGDVVVIWGDGRTDLFDERGGTYTPVNEAVSARLEQFEANKFRVITREGIQFLFEEPAHRRLTRIQDTNENSLAFSYDTNRQLTTIADAAGRHIFLAYTNRRLTTVTDPNTTPARTLQFAYNTQGDQVSLTDQLGNITSYIYDSTHLLTGISDPLGITTISYTAPGRAVGAISRSTLQGATLSARSFSYDTLTTAVVDTMDGGVSAVTRYRYDAARHLIGITDPLGHTETRTYHPDGQIATITDANNNTARFAYDTRGNVTTTTDPRGQVTAFQYDSALNKLTSVTNANNNTTTFSYDVNGNLRRVADPLGHTTEYVYDTFGQLLSRRNARGFTTAFTYDSFGDLTSISNPLDQITTFTYDRVGNALTKTDAANNTTAYTYDARNRLRLTRVADLSEASFTYDAGDNILSAIDPNTNLVFAYDANGRVIQVTDSRLAKTISYQYDGVGNRIRMTGPEGQLTAYRYDAASRLDRISRNGQQFDFAYDDANRPTRLTLPNGSATSYTYDSADNLLSLVNRRSDGGVISSFTYEYDDAGNRIALTQADGGRVDYAYDPMNQLIREVRVGSVRSYDHTFAYDGVGNRVRFDADGVIATYVYNEAEQLTEEARGVISTFYNYDPNGNRTRKSVGGLASTYSYDVSNRLVNFNSAGRSASYSYDAFGRRIQKSVDGIITEFLFDDLDAIAEVNASGDVVAHHLYGAGIDANLATFADGQTFYVMRDGLNSVRNIVDATETVRNSYDYDGWGSIIARLETVANRYTFTGREIDDESGLYYYRARMYDPLIGAFTQLDPLDGNLGRSLYIYVENRPASNVDPGGLWSLLGAIAAVVAVVAVVVLVLAIPPVGAAVAAAPAAIGAVAGLVLETVGLVSTATTVAVAGASATAATTVVVANAVAISSVLGTVATGAAGLDYLITQRPAGDSPSMPLRSEPSRPAVATPGSSGGSGSNADHNGDETGTAYAGGAAGDGSNKGDATGEGMITREDVATIFDNRGQPARPPFDDPQDVDVDDMITVNDARVAALRCSNPGCAP